VISPGSRAGAAAAPASPNARTVLGARRELAAKLRACGIESPELDARILVGHALGVEPAALVAAANRQLSAAQEAAIAALTHRRLAREPVARILGVKEFWSLPFYIATATLVPRPETETVVEAALAVIDGRGARLQPLRIADLGTGCGALLLALLSELPNSWGVGSDVSVGALGVAQNNARHLALARASFVACDMTAALRGPFDMVVSNPPYVASGDIAMLAPEVRDFEPRRALDGGADGLAFHRMIAAVAPALLSRNGVIVVELGAGQAESATALFAAAGLAVSPPRPDLNGVPRALIASKRA